MRRYPNFDLIRLLAASTVIFSHAFLIAEGSTDGEPLMRTTGEILGVYAVHAFFVLSGFLVTESAIRTAGAGRFLWKRAPVASCGNAR